ncbi:MAG: alpha/beta hydrolase [Balneolaceae bacterium]|nr:alpha/beta hydrolase [Balneolaceae bacterium]
MNQEVLATGKTSFKIEVPHKLIETGDKSGEKKPLIVYLHGYNQNIEYFEKKVEDLLNLKAYHLFIQGPYPIYDESREKKVPQWGRAWYLYDGRQEQFVRSLELSSEFIQEVIDSLLKHINVSRIAVIGYSMGGYQAGYFALSRWKHVNELAVVGGRIKTEVFENRKGEYGHMNVLALHGAQDESVESEPQKESAGQLQKWGAKVMFRELDEGHKLSNAYLREIKGWLLEQGYTEG